MGGTHTDDTARIGEWGGTHTDVTLHALGGGGAHTLMTLHALGGVEGGGAHTLMTHSMHCGEGGHTHTACIGAWVGGEVNTHTYTHTTHLVDGYTTVELSAHSSYTEQIKGVH